MYRSGMGDYRYRRMMVAGDPGFLGNLFRGIGHIAVGGIGGFLKGGLPGAIAGAATGAVSGTAANVRRETLAAGGSASALTPELRAAHARALARANATAPIGSSLPGTPHGTVHRALTAGRVSGGGGGRRRMNWANAKALGRAERRIHSAVKHFSKYIRWVHPTKQGHAVPKFKRRKKG